MYGHLFTDRDTSSLLKDLSTDAQSLSNEPRGYGGLVEKPVQSGPVRGWWKKRSRLDEGWKNRTSRYLPHAVLWYSAMFRKAPESTFAELCESSAEHLSATRAVGGERSHPEPARELTAARPNCKSRSAPYHTPHGSRRATDRAPDGSLTETGRKIRRTLGVMTPAGVYAEDMPNGRRFKCDLSISGNKTEYRASSRNLPHGVPQYSRTYRGIPQNVPRKLMHWTGFSTNPDTATEISRDCGELLSPKTLGKLHPPGSDTMLPASLLKKKKNLGRKKYRDWDESKEQKEGRGPKGRENATSGPRNSRVWRLDRAGLLTPKAARRHTMLLDIAYVIFPTPRDTSSLLKDLSTDAQSLSNEVWSL
ncbi:hypothetical protein Bbelb_313810 [Branchiostoma belcheri]|nr:hypothetical protein Bbelb_313810 [Branchiostoma belcheri]